MTTHLDIGGSPQLLALAGGPVVAVLRAALMLPRSSGCLRLASVDPLVAPVVDLNYLDDPHDRVRLRQATRMAWRLARSAPMAQHSDGVVALDEDTVASDDRSTATCTHISAPIATPSVPREWDRRAIRLPSWTSMAAFTEREGFGSWMRR